MDKKVLGILLIGFVLISGCIQGPETESGGKTRQELTMGILEDIGGLEPGSSNGLWQLTFLVYDGLVKHDTEYNKIPGLAESWEMSEDGKEWTFDLRKGVKFHDGSDFSCGDVKFTFEKRVEDMKKGKGVAMGLRFLERIECTDDYTAKFVFSKPNFIFASDLSMQTNPVMSTTAFDGEGNVKEAIGTGPFKLIEWVKSQQIIFEKNPDYWSGPVKLDKIIVKIIPSPETLAMALESGEIDLMNCEGSLTTVPTLKLNPDIRIESKVTSNTNMVYMKTQKEPFNDLRVRRAINYAIDKTAIVNAHLADTAAPAGYMFAPAFKRFINSDAKNYGFDREKAKELLAEAGWLDSDGDGVVEKNGKPFKVTLTIRSDSAEDRVVGESIQSQLKEVGIDASLKPVEYSTLRGIKGKGDFDLLLCGQWYIPHDDPSNNYRAYFSSKGTFKMYTNETLDDLIDRFEITGDPEERLKLHHEIQKEIMDNAPAAYLYNGFQNVAMRKYVKGVESYTGYWNIYRSLDQVYIEE